VVHVASLEAIVILQRQRFRVASADQDRVNLAFSGADGQAQRLKPHPMIDTVAVLRLYEFSADGGRRSTLL